MIALSPTMEEGTIVRWNKKEGDSLAIGDLLCEVETDKATMEYEAQTEGTLLKILVDAGGQARVADIIGVSGKPGEDVAAMVAEAQAARNSAPAAPAAEAASAALTTPAVAAVASASQGPAVPAAPGARVKASPLARRLASESGLDLSRVPGSGPGGRVVKRDVEGYSAPPVAALAATASRSGRVDEIIPVSRKRKVTAQRLMESKFQAPHYYLKLSLEMGGLMEARARLNARRKEKVSFNAFIHKMAAEALGRHPMVNAGWQGETIRKFGSIDIGLAVAVTDGLITPVVRDCGSKGVLAIDEELKVLIARAQEGKLQPEEYTGATFTISNLGSFGIDEFTAIINPPGSAILALGRIQKVPVVVEDDELEIRSVMRASLSCDHRVIDGATGAAFLTDLKEMIENPFSALY